MAIGDLLRLPEVARRTGLGKSSIWVKVAEGTFPQPVRFGARCTRWIESEIEAWKAALIEKRDGPKTKPGKGRKGGEHEHEQPAA
jgi:prophage regulatory protein